MAFLTNPANPSMITEAASKEMTEAASRLGGRLLILSAASPSEIERAFATLTEQRAGALAVGADPFFLAQRAQILAVAARYRVPASYFLREFVEAGRLTSYSSRQGDPLILAGAYVGRILNGAKPGHLPVQRPTRYEFVINLKTASALGLTIPPNLLAIADEVIE
jgi:putative tryptophan/tyrosine transport system substrate-binding protein